MTRQEAEAFLLSLPEKYARMIRLEERSLIHASKLQGSIMGQGSHEDRTGQAVADREELERLSKIFAICQVWLNNRLIPEFRQYLCSIWDEVKQDEAAAMIAVDGWRETWSEQMDELAAGMTYAETVSSWADLTSAAIQTKGRYVLLQKTTGQEQGE